MPNALDNHITGVIENWIAAKSAAPLDALEEQRGMLMGYGERTASLAVRNGDPRFILFGLLALAPVWEMGDERDTIIILSILYDAAVMIKSDPNQLFREAQRLCFSNRPFRSAINGFIARNEADKAISVMGYVRASDDDGFRYHRTW